MPRDLASVLRQFTFEMSLFDKISRRFAKREEGGSASGGGLQEFTKKLTRLDPAMAGDWLSGVFRGKSFPFYSKLLSIMLCAYFMADLAAITAGKLLPEVAPAHVRSGFNGRAAKSIDDYNAIFARNLFSSTGTIPGEETGGPDMQDMGGAPVRTTLPFDLIGTLILSDELRSIATIEDKTAQLVYPVREQDDIPSKAHILKIEPRRVVFLNTTNHHREFVDLPESSETNSNRISLGTGMGGGGIEQTSPNSFSVSRSEVDKALSNMNNILTQARALPNFENGQPAGYKIIQIVPGSIYSQLGLVDGDVICGFDGQSANDPAVAFEKLSHLKDASHLDLCVKRGGKQTTNSYDFK